MRSTRNIEVESNMQSIKLLTIAAATLALGGIAQADTYPETNSVVVKYGDLNLGSDEGVKSLHRRIRNAAASVCGTLETKILGLRDAYDDCVTKAIADSVAKVDNPNLSNFHAGRRPPAMPTSRS
jgi:UrcA family protein